MEIHQRSNLTQIESEENIMGAYLLVEMNALLYCIQFLVFHV